MVVFCTSAVLKKMILRVPDKYMILCSLMRIVPFSQYSHQTLGSTTSYMLQRYLCMGHEHGPKAGTIRSITVVTYLFLGEGVPSSEGEIEVKD